MNGNACRPYREDDPTCPVSAYGRTKLEGEQLVQQALPSAVIVRTAWLYAPWGHNFVNTMVKLGRERTNLRVVVDQVGTPTYAPDLADAIVAIIAHDEWKPGIYHFSNEGAISWYDFTKTIHQMCNIDCDVQPCNSEDYPTPAHRPHYSVLDKSKIKAAFGIAIPYWRNSLLTCLKRTGDYAQSN